jgi:hypothetical protein
MPTNPLDLVPIWGVYVTTIVIVLGFVELGFFLGLAKRRRSEDVKEAAVGSMVGATLGLLAFMLAFSFGAASSRHDNRRSLVLEETNALHSAFRYAEFLPQTQRSEVRSLLRAYVETRLKWVGRQDVGDAISRSEEILPQLWFEAVAAGEKDPHSVVGGLFIEALNEVIELHTKRVRAGLWSRIPAAILYVLFFVTFLAMTSMGYLAGIAGKRTNLVTIALVLAFSTVLFLIIDLDRSWEGLIEVSQRPLQELLQKMTVSP